MVPIFASVGADFFAYKHLGILIVKNCRYNWPRLVLQHAKNLRGCVLKKSIPSAINSHTSKIKEWFTLTKLIALVFLLLGIAGLIPGPIPYLPIPGLPEFHENISPELFGIGITVLIIETANERSQSRREKARLIQQFGSQDNGFALEAARILRLNGWLKDGSLTKAQLTSANLENALLLNAELSASYLMWAKLKKVNLAGANLKNANLLEADLTEARLVEASLNNANFFGANLSYASLLSTNAEYVKLATANLSRADLSLSNMHGADMSKTNLQGARFIRAKLTAGNFSEAKVCYANFKNANLEGANFFKADLTWADFSGANTKNVDFTNAILDSANITEAQLSSAASVEGVSAEHPHLRDYAESKEMESNDSELHEYDHQVNERYFQLNQALLNIAKKKQN